MKLRKPRMGIRYKPMRELTRGRRKCRILGNFGGNNRRFQQGSQTIETQHISTTNAFKPLTIRDEPAQVCNVRKDGNTDLTSLGDG